MLIGPYVFREAQATVFRHLYGYWQDYQAMSHGLSQEEIETELNRQREKLRKVLFLILFYACTMEYIPKPGYAEMTSKSYIVQCSIWLSNY